MEKLKKVEKRERNTGIDIIRIIALLSVISGHFFSYVGFYDIPVTGGKMFVAVIIRNFFRISVPLFLMITGYLMCNKKLEKKYYSTILKTIYTYIIATVLCVWYKNRISGNVNIKLIIRSILDYSGSGYAWYVEMYIGLFLIIPFLNLIYKNLNSKKDKKVLLITFMFLTTIPLITNCFNIFMDGWWQKPTISYNYNKIIPAYWLGLYPITYYFIGCYIREYEIKFNKILNMGLLIVTVIVTGIFNYYRNYEVLFQWDLYQNFGSLLVMSMAYLLFIFFINIDYSKFPKIMKKILGFIAEACFGAYLISEIFDIHFYNKLNAIVPVIVERFKYIFVMVPMIFICAIITSMIINFSYKIIKNVVGYIKNKKNIEEKMSNG